MVRTLAWTLPYIVALQYSLVFAFGVHRLAWRYVGLPDVARIAKVIGLGVAALLGVRLFVPGVLLSAAPWAVRSIIPAGIILTFGILSFLGTVGVRVVRRFVSERAEADDRVRSERAPIRTILIGAGRAGVLAAKEAVARPDMGIVPVGFLDDDLLKVGTVVRCPGRRIDRGRGPPLRPARCRAGPHNDGIRAGE